MKDKQNTPAFPYSWPWEDFKPTVCTLFALREDPRYFLRLEVARDGRRIDGKPSSARVAAIATALELGKDRQDRLALDFALIVSWYLGPQVQKLLDIDVAAGRRELARAAKTAGELRSALGQIDTIIGASFRDLYNETAADQVAVPQPIVFDYMATELVKIERTSLTLINALKPLKAGRPSNFFRDAALALMCQALQEVGAKPITISHGTGHRAGAHLHFTNPSGRAVLALFKLCDHRVDESLLVRSFVRVKQKRKSSNLAENRGQEH